MRRVILESPYGDPDPAIVAANVAYAKRCIRDSLARGESPLASHVYLTQPGILDDNIPVQRAIGISAGLAWLSVAQATVAYMDRGVSNGMKHGIAVAEAAGIPVEYRWLEDDGA